MFPQLEHLRHFDGVVRSRLWDLAAIDIENAGDYITLIGLTLMNSETAEIGLTLGLPFRSRFGQRYWEHRAEHDQAVEYLGDWLADLQLGKVFHNGTAHDVPLLEAIGFEVNGEVWDTMTMQRYAYPECRKGLQYCSTLYLGTPNWKTLLDEDEDAEGKS